ncbi:hypothetical protein ThrDRAFT_01304 [Frankia casuarinae]|nr:MULTISPECIES: hypothetical protein [Frankia]ETA02729.1 hypothetical protein CcI6DRAFT_01909 [Frankia sp. CcI6]EYT93115.1 hypothetical protein ThrDRAFT_01304 [Frankia casuarinae]OAA30520.1 hypothetical protein AAY23_100786 [Frankia casuarinae]
MITADTYTHILPDLAAEIARNTARLIPRTRSPQEYPRHTTTID